MYGIIVVLNVRWQAGRLPTSRPTSQGCGRYDRYMPNARFGHCIDCRDGGFGGKILTPDSEVDAVDALVAVGVALDQDSRAGDAKSGLPSEELVPTANLGTPNLPICAVS